MGVTSASSFQALVQLSPHMAGHANSGFMGGYKLTQPAVCVAVVDGGRVEGQA